MRDIPDGRGGVLADNSAFRRKVASLRVRLGAVEALEGRAAAGRAQGLETEVAAAVLTILRDELHFDVCVLAAEALGYYALPMPEERPGDNEAPPGGAYAHSARRGMLARLFEPPGNPGGERDRLARQLLEAGHSGEPDTEH